MIPHPRSTLLLPARRTTSSCSSPRGTARPPARRSPRWLLRLAIWACTPTHRRRHTCRRCVRHMSDALQPPLTRRHAYHAQARVLPPLTRRHACGFGVRHARCVRHTRSIHTNAGTRVDVVSDTLAALDTLVAYSFPTLSMYIGVCM